MTKKIDDVDITILNLLQREGRIKRGDIAKAVNMSIPSVSERLRKLEKDGYILHYTAVLSPQKVGLDMMAFIFIDLESSSFDEDLIKHAQEEPQVLECHAITGSGSHVLKVRTPKTVDLQNLLHKIRSWPGVKDTRTSVVLSSAKEHQPLPLAISTQSRSNRSKKAT